MDRFGYKTFVVRDGKLTSIYYNHLGGLGIVYKAGEVIRPKDEKHPIFVFDDMYEACSYSGSDSVVFKVLYKKSRFIPEENMDLYIDKNSVFASEMCLLYPVFLGRDIPTGMFTLYKEDDSKVSKKKVIVI